MLEFLILMEFVMLNVKECISYIYYIDTYVYMYMYLLN